jgi:hypothetical protein
MSSRGTERQLGIILSGSLSNGFLMRIDPQVPLHTIKAGRFVSIRSGDGLGQGGTFFSLITDITLNITNPDVMSFPPEPHEKLLARAVAQQFVHCGATLRPMLLLLPDGSKMPVKTIPPHFAPVFEASADDVVRVFGAEDASGTHFNIGTPLDMQVPVCIDMQAFAERSNGIFGKTGTGKTFLTRLLLAGLIKSDQAATIIFDMHSEYGLQSRREGGAAFVKGLKLLFPSKVAIFSLDPASTRRRGGSPDAIVTIPYQAILVQDILALQEELSLHPTACEAAYLLATRYQNKWLETLLARGSELKELAAATGAHPESLAALYRKLKIIERFACFTPETGTSPNGTSGDIIDLMMDYINRGMSVVVEFGNYTSTFCYLLIANILTRRIHALYMKKTETYLGSQRPEDEPKKLLITIEEAHKFLNPIAASQTIFGTIAREMRKYFVSLLVIDQRPSGIDQEILSQVGTKIIAQLNDERDISAVLSGVNNAAHLKTVLSSLDTKKQVLVIGHAIAMPIVVQTRTYDETFYADLAKYQGPPPADLTGFLYQQN